MKRAQMARKNYVCKSPYIRMRRRVRMTRGKQEKKSRIFAYDRRPGQAERLKELIKNLQFEENEKKEKLKKIFRAELPKCS